MSAGALHGLFVAGHSPRSGNRGLRHGTPSVRPRERPLERAEDLLLLGVHVFLLEILLLLAEQRGEVHAPVPTLDLVLCSARGVVLLAELFRLSEVRLMKKFSWSFLSHTPS